LDKVTPVIAALFGGYSMDESYPRQGRGFNIARISEENTALLDEVFENLKDFAAGLSISISERDTENIRTLLKLLSGHFNGSRRRELCNRLEHDDFDDDTDLGTLFIIATRFDDGHRLKAIKLEGAWHCSRPRLFEFGGDGVYLSSSVSVYNNSTTRSRSAKIYTRPYAMATWDQAAEHIEKDVLSCCRHPRRSSSAK